MLNTGRAGARQLVSLFAYTNLDKGETKDNAPNVTEQQLQEDIGECPGDEDTNAASDLEDPQLIGLRPATGQLREASSVMKMTFVEVIVSLMILLNTKLTTRTLKRNADD